MTAPKNGGGRTEAVPEPALATSAEQTETPDSTVHPFPTPPPKKLGTTFHLTDLGNAERLVDGFGADLRYNPVLGKWRIWDGRRWSVDQTGEIFRRAKRTVNLIYAQIAGASSADECKALATHAKQSQSVSRIRAMVELARTEPPIPVLPDQLDVDPWLLNTLNGTIDLRTGDLREHRREDLITKLAPVEYDSVAQAPMFMSFLARITGEDEELQRFIQKAIGYALTGDTSEQVIFLLCGVGANGKSTFINAIQDILDEYALQTTTQTLIRKRDRSATNDIARLRGARFVVAVEVDEDGKLDEVLVKQMTGGDKIAVRFLYKEFFEFRPECKIFLITNYTPTIKGSDQGIWRRILLVPFDVIIPEGKRDKHLLEKLRKELPGILTWAVEGCLAWQREGLNPPERVRAATESYRAEMDWLSAFLAERCSLEDAAKTPAADLYAAFGTWWSRDDELPNQKNFGGRLSARGLHRFKKSGKIWWHGIALKPKDHRDQ